MPTVVLVDSDNNRRQQLALALTSVGGLRVDEHASAPSAIAKIHSGNGAKAMIIEAREFERGHDVECSIPILAFAVSPQPPHLSVPVVTLSMAAIPAFATQVVRFIAKTI